MKSSENDKRLISVIVDATRFDEDLEETLRSLWAQSFKRFEILVVCKNEGSKEKIKARIEESGKVKGSAQGKGQEAGKAEDLTDICFICSDADTTGGALNAGISKARGRWFMTLESGDMLEPSALKSLHTNCVSQELELTICGLTASGRRGRRRLCCEDEIAVDVEAFINTVFTDCYDKGLFFAHGNKLYLKTLAVKAGLYDEDIGALEELEFCFRYMARSSNIGVLKKVFLREHSYRGETVDVEACTKVLRAYNALFDAEDIDDGIVDTMNDRMLKLYLETLRSVYASDRISETEKLRLLAGTARKKELLSLISDTSAGSADIKAFSFMIKHKLLDQLSFFLGIGNEREDIELYMKRGTRKAEGDTEEGIGLGSEDGSETELEAETGATTGSEKRFLPKFRIAVEDESIPKGEAKTGNEADTDSVYIEPGRLSDAEIEEIGRCIESGLEDL